MPVCLEHGARLSGVSSHRQPSVMACIDVRSVLELQQAIGGVTERAALWARVSTDDQVVDDQLLPLRAEAARRGLEVVREFSVAESAFLGKHWRELGKLIAEVSAYDVVIVWTLDRLSREGIGKNVATLRDRCAP
jgi:predicted site-specific integrase-resolvase